MQVNTLFAPEVAGLQDQEVFNVCVCAKAAVVKKVNSTAANDLTPLITILSKKKATLLWQLLK
ncbi:MAG: hypothetical protein EAZ43_01865 [Betaproteobacteria bacterium]|nr:MAG: hypothetical protein EAZ43_01865 [Betaproteobacteria bacterium]